MFRRGGASLAALALGAQALLAQGDTRPQQRLARLRALADSVRLVSRTVQGNNLAAARHGEHGDVLLVMPSSFTQSEADEIALRVDSQVTEVGILEPRDVRRVVLVDAALGNPPGGALLGRRAVLFNYPSVQRANERPDAIASGAAHAVVSALLDPQWADYLDRAIDFAWSPREYNLGVMRDLLASPREAARECTAGARCDVYLGINAGGIRTWLTSAEIRARLAENTGNGPMRDACRQPTSQSCYDYFIQSRERPPAGSGARRSLILFVRETMGADVARALINDHHGPIHDRLARATGKTPAALAADWRLWVLSTSERRAVSAGWREAAATAAALALLLALVTRSKRWAL